ncbi:serine protease family S33, partial [Thraustotheca clavata]
TDTFTNDRYEELFYQSVIPQIPKLRGAVVFLHGFGDHGSGYLNFFEHLAESGYAVFCFDYIGHGKSEGDRAFFEKYQYMLDDIDQFISLCKNEVDKANLEVNKWNLIGISFGGLLSALTIVRELHTFNNVVLIAPSINVPLTWVLWVQKQFAFVLSTLFPKWRIVPGVVREKLSREEDALRGYDMDDLSFHGLAPARSGEQILYAMEELSSKKFSFKTPLLMVMGDDERVVCTTSIREFYRDVQSQDKELIVFEEAGHMLMRESKSLEVENRIIQWLDERSPFPTK